MQARQIVRLLSGFTLAGALALVGHAGAASALTFSRYHSEADIAAALRDAAAAHPDFVSFHVLGASEQGREIAYVVVGANPALPAIYLNGTHHGNEPSATESALGVLDHLLTHQTDPDVAALLAHYRIFIQPLVNADGFAADTREDPEGRDPNRDYAFPDRADADSFQIPFVRLVKGLLDQEKFRAAVAYHSGETSVLWPWCYEAAETPDRDAFYTLAKNAAEAMGTTYYVQSYDDYATEGEFIDYAYMRHHTFALTFEVSDEKRPATGDLPVVVANAVKGTMAFMSGILAQDSGTLALQPAPRARPAGFLNQLAVLRGYRTE